VGTGELTVDFVGQVRTLSPGESLSFGRAAGLVSTTPTVTCTALSDDWWHDGV
jgi:hypothetical protein